jgi:hypothetical protein
VVLHGVVNMQLPNQWLWDMVDEFVYQFQSFCQYRAKMKNKTEQEIDLLRQFDQVKHLFLVIWEWFFCNGSLIAALLIVGSIGMKETMVKWSIICGCYLLEAGGFFFFLTEM